MSNLPVVNKGRTDLQKLTPLQLYLQEVARYPLLSPEEEYELAVKTMESGDVQAAHRLVTSNLRLVIKIANDFRQAQSNFLDLIQEGNYGLIQAVRKFNPYKGVKLSSYAAWWIRAYILKYIMDNKSQVKIGTTAVQRRLFFRLRKETEKLLAEYDHADPKLLAERLAVAEEDVIEMQQRLSGPDVSLDEPLGDEPGDAARGSLLASAEVAADELIASHELIAKFSQHLDEFEKTLEGRDLEIFRSRMLSDSPVTLQDIGDRYGITRERARQIEARIVKKLKDYVDRQGTIIDI